MGIEAQMYVVNTGPTIDDDGILNLSQRLLRSCGRESFWIVRPNERPSATKGHSAMTAATSVDLKYIDLVGAPDGQVIKVHLSGRYYREGYERGSLRDYVWIAEVIERLIPGCAIFYGGDAHEAHHSFDKARRDELIDHLLSVNGDHHLRSLDMEG